MKPFAHLLTLLAMLPMAVFAQQVEGPNSPQTTDNLPYLSCGTCAGAIWDSTSNIAAPDGQVSTAMLEPDLECFQSTCYRSRYLVAYNFGFNIPMYAVIDGVTIDVIGVPSANGSVRDSTICLRRDAFNNTYGTNMASASPWSISSPQHTYGGPTELWGLTWSTDDVNSPDFGCFIKLYNSSNNNRSVDIDLVTITINYSIGLETFSITSSPQVIDTYFNNEGQQLNISSTSNSESEVIITDMTGRTCINQMVQPGTTLIDTAELAPGMYSCTVICEGKVYTEKFVK